MEEKRAKIFVSHHPGDLLLYKNVIALIKKVTPKACIILFKVNHRYYHMFDFSPYKSHFDLVEEFPFVTYQKNPLRGAIEMRQFKKGLARAKALLGQFDHIDVYMQNSGWLPVNMLLFFFSKLEKVRHVFRWNFGMEDHKKTKKDHLRTLYCRLYQAIFRGSFSVEAMATLGGKFVDFRYAQPVPGKKLTVVSPARKVKQLQKMELPFPIIKRDGAAKKDMVIIFGNADILTFKEYVDDYKGAKKKLVTFFEELDSIYRDYKIYYKPHPADTKLMPGIKKGRYHSFTNNVNTQVILDRYYPQIKATYTVFSTSAMWSSFFGIPSYVTYGLVYNHIGIQRFDYVFTQKSIASPLIALVSSKAQIGSIDNLKDSRKYVNLDHIDEPYHRILTL